MLLILPPREGPVTAQPPRQGMALGAKGCSAGGILAAHTDSSCPGACVLLSASSPSWMSLFAFLDQIRRPRCLVWGVFCFSKEKRVLFLFAGLFQPGLPRVRLTHRGPGSAPH